jgi:16S rRNA (cytosine967-C5)-methyltransferase
LRCTAANRIAPLTVRVNRLQTERHDLLAVWQPENWSAAATPLSPDGIVISAFQGPVGRIPGFDRGWFQVQDEAAQLVAFLVAPAPGMRILDACAGRGVKTGHLAALARDRAEILATDCDDRKLDDLKAEMHRLGISSVSPLKADWLAGERLEVGGLFDAVLIDAPCSGLGVIRRNPDTKWHRQEKDLRRHAERQLALLRTLAERVKPGGTMVYAVCSIEPEETEAVIDALLQERPDFTVQAPGPRLPSAAHRLIDSGGRVKIDPALEAMDGFFMVRLIRGPAP